MSRALKMMVGRGGVVAPTFNPVSDWSLPPLHAFSTADPYWVPPADAGSVSSWRNAGSAVKGAYIGAKGLVLPGITGNYASTPDAAALDITGDITIVAKVTASDWTPAASFIPIGKNNTTTQRSYHLAVITTGELRLTWSTTGSDAPFETSTVATGFADGSTHWIAGTLDVNDGSGNHVVKFWTSDDGTTWTQLGTTVTTAGTTSIWAGTEPLTIGGVVSGTSSLLTGTVHRAQIYSGVRDFSGTPSGGTLAFDADFEAATEDATSFTESSSNAATVTINSVPRAAHINANGLALQGNTTTARTDCAIIADNAVTRPTGDMEVIVKATATDWTPAAGKVLVLSGSNGVNPDINWYLYYNTGGTLTFARPSGGIARAFTSSVATGLADGATKWIKVTYDQDNGAGNAECKFYLSDDGSTWTQLGTTQTYASTAAGNSNTTGITIGQAAVSAVGHAGTIHRVIAKDGIGGTTFLDVDFESANPNLSQFTESSSNALTVTIVSSVDPVQATGSKQPTYDAANANYNNAPTVHFTTDDVLAVNITDVAQPYYAVVIGNVTSTNGARDVLVGFGGSTDRGLFDGSTATWALNAGTNVTGGTPDSNPHLFVAQLNSTLSSIEIDGIPIASSSAGTNSLTVLSLGAGNTAVGTYAYYLNGDIHTALIFQGDPRLQPEWADFEAYVESTTAIDVTPSPVTLQAPTLLDTTSGGTTSLVSDSISPSANSLIVIACVGVQTAAPYVSATTLSGLSTWGSVTVDSGGAETTLLWSKVTGSPGTGTITVTGYGAAGGTRNQMAILEVVGANTIRQVKSGTSTSAAPSLVFDITPLSSSLVVAAFGQEGSGYQAATPGANFTELVEVGGDRCIQVQYDLTGASSTVDWSLGGSRQYGAVAIEITDE